jgi:cell division protein FtsQ
VRVWNNAQTLNRLAGALFLTAIGLVLIALVWRIANFEAFAVRGIDVVGNVSHVTREQVDTIARDELKGTFFTVDLRGAQAAFEKLPWVRRVDVRRRWPNRLEFAVQEHHAMARWGSTALVNRYGEIFEGASNERLVVFEGPQGSELEITRNFRRFSKSLALIGRRIKSVEVSERRAWRLRLGDGAVIELGRDDVAERLGRFVAVYARSVGTMAVDVDYIDLRYTNGFAVRASAKKGSERRA